LLASELEPPAKQRHCQFSQQVCQLNLMPCNPRTAATAAMLQALLQQQMLWTLQRTPLLASARSRRRAALARGMLRIAAMSTDRAGRRS